MRNLLRSIWDDPAPSEPPPVGTGDVVLVGALLGLAVFEAALRPDLPHPVLSVVALLVLVPVLLVRRTRPLVAVSVAFAGSLVAQLLTGGEPLENYTQACFLLLPYALARWAPGREVVLGTGVLLLTTTTSLVASSPTLSDVVGGIAVLLTALALGAAFRFRSRSREREIEQVRSHEREDLARDLHDVVAHHVSAMAVQAQAGIAMAPTEPEAAVDALRVIEAEATRALTEMRSMVRVLRSDEPATRAPTPRLDDLDDLAGLGSTDGSPIVQVTMMGDADGVAPAVAAGVYRLAQEAVTNARRHARRPTHIDVRVDVDETTVRLEVADDGEAQPVRPGAPTAYGLVGMRERASLLGGTFEAGPDSVGGWTVTAVLPRDGVDG